LKLRGRADNTRRLYAFSVRNFSTFLQRDALLVDLTDDNVSRLMAWMMGRGLSPSSANKERSQLLAIWRFACRKGFLQEWPDVDPEVQPDRDPRAWTMPQLESLFAACRATPGYIGPVPAGLWWETLHNLGWDTAERISPLRKSRWEWFDLDGGWVRVPAEFRKGKRKDMTYELHAETVALLRRLRTFSKGDEVFPWPFSESHIYYRYAEVQRRAGLPSSRQFRFHCLRKSAATHGKRLGLDPQLMLGHEDGKTTRKYLDPTICGQQSAAKILPRPGLPAVTQELPRIGLTRRTIALVRRWFGRKAGLSR